MTQIKEEHDFAVLALSSIALTYSFENIIPTIVSYRPGKQQQLNICHMGASHFDDIVILGQMIPSLRNTLLGIAYMHVHDSGSESYRFACDLGLWGI